MLVEYFLLIAQHLPEPHLLLSVDGRVIAANLAAKRKLAIANDSENNSIYSLSKDSPEKLKQTLSMWARSNSPLPASITLGEINGESIVCLCKGSLLRPQEEDAPSMLMVQCLAKQQSLSAFVTLNEKIAQLQRQVVERRNAEAEVRRLNEMLEARVKERTSQLEQANQELSTSLDELKQAQDHLVRTERLAALGGMVAGVAHEINTPVGISVTAASYLKNQMDVYQQRYGSGTLTREDFEQMLKEADEASSIVLANLSRAAELVQGFKQLAVDQVSDERRALEIHTYVKEILVSINPLFRRTSHNIELDCAEDIQLVTYPGAIAQIINNLISNSLLHGFEGIDSGKIHLRITREGREMLIHYADNGVGMSQNNLRKIFDPFFTTKRNRGGSGLGANIIYNLVTAKLGGKINVTSEEGQGMHFYIRLPIEHVELAIA